jgi:dUTP pyrophosphatase
LTKIKYQKIHPKAKLPTFGTEDAACFDVYACEGVCLDVGIATKVRTGWKVEVPKGWFIEVRPRSGLSLKGIIIPNSPCTIDSDFRGEWVTPMMALTDEYVISAGDRIAQARIVRIEQVEFEEVTELSKTVRDEGGFGSSGK